MKRSHRSKGLPHVGLVLALWLAPAGLVLAEGTIAYVRPNEPLFNDATRGLRGIELDLNGDAQMDCRFFDASQGGFYFATAGAGVGTARLLVTPQGPYDLGSDLVGLNEGFLIGGSLNPILFWAAHDAPSYYGEPHVLGAAITEEGQTIPVGYFYGRTAFMGIHFQIGSDWHYGWVRIRGGRFGDELTLVPPGWILDWAYETRPDIPIFAGAVPEPSTWSLFALAGVGLWIYRRRFLRIRS